MRALGLLPFGKSPVSPPRMGSFSFRSSFDRSALNKGGWVWLGGFGAGGLFGACDGLGLREATALGVSDCFWGGGDGFG